MKNEGVSSIEIKLNRNDQVTKIIAKCDSPDTLPILCSELERCCGHGILFKKQPNQTYHLFPKHDVIIKDIPETWNFLSTQLAGFVDDLGFHKDEPVIFTQELLDKLFTLLNNCQKSADVRSISTLINYIFLEGWSGCCDTPHCTNYVPIENVLEKYSLLCDKCQLSNN